MTTVAVRHDRVQGGHRMMFLVATLDSGERIRSWYYLDPTDARDAQVVADEQIARIESRARRREIRRAEETGDTTRTYATARELSEAALHGVLSRARSGELLDTDPGVYARYTDAQVANIVGGGWTEADAAAARTRINAWEGAKSDLSGVRDPGERGAP